MFGKIEQKCYSLCTMTTFSKEFWITLIVVLAVSAGVWYMISPTPPKASNTAFSATTIVADGGDSTSTTPPTPANHTQEIEDLQKKISQINAESANAVSGMNSNPN